MLVWRVERADDGMGLFYGSMAGTAALGRLIPGPHGDGVWDRDTQGWEYRFGFPREAVGKVLRCFTGDFIHNMGIDSFRVVCFEVPAEAVSMGNSGMQCIFDLARAERVSNGAEAL